MHIKQPGFTLVELMIAIALMALISLLLFASFSVGIKTWDAVERQTNKMAEQRLVWRFFKKSLNEVIDIKVRREQRNISLFSGTKEAIEFVSPIAKRAGIGGLSIIRIGLVRQGGQQLLVVNRWLYHPEVIAGEVTERRWKPLSEDDRLKYKTGLKEATYGEHLLAKNIEELEFEYLFKKEEEWELEWTRKTFPLLVKIKIKKNGDWWEELIIQLPYSLKSRNPFSLAGGQN